MKSNQRAYSIEYVRRKAFEIPDDISLISLFECEPTLLDTGVPYFCNEATYKFSNQNNEDFCVSIRPSYNESFCHPIRE